MFNSHSATVTVKATDLSCLPAQCFATFIFPTPSSWEETKCSKLSVRFWVLWSQEFSPCSKQRELKFKRLKDIHPHEKEPSLGNLGAKNLEACYILIQLIQINK